MVHTSVMSVVVQIHDEVGTMKEEVDPRSSGTCSGHWDPRNVLICFSLQNGFLILNRVLSTCESWMYSKTGMNGE